MEERYNLWKILFYKHDKTILHGIDFIFNSFTMYNMKKYINLTIEELKGRFKDKTYLIKEGNLLKGVIEYSYDIDKISSIPPYCVYSKYIFGNTYKHKRYKTLRGAISFINNAKKKTFLSDIL